MGNENDLSIEDNGDVMGGINGPCPEGIVHFQSPLIPANTVFAPSGVEILRLTKEGMYYKGEFMPDVGAAHKAFMEAMEALKSQASRP